MKLSQAFWQTYKDDPADAEIPSHRLMMRAGLLHKSGAGLYNYLPFALRSIKKVEKIVREEMEKIGGQEILMSVVTPGELWQESGRWEKMGDLMLRFKDKGKKDLCISPTNEEAVVDIFRSVVKSYKQLPLTLYQINTKFRDEIRPRFGLIRGREFTMKDAYSFHADKKSLDIFYEEIYKAYENVFKRIGLDFIAVEADGGAMASSDSKTHEFQLLAETGEDTIIYSREAGYAANVEKAVTKRANVNFNLVSKQLSEVSTPGKATIKDVCDFLGVPEFYTLKSLIYNIIIGNKEETVLLLLLGDDELNEVKVAAHFKADHVKASAEKDLFTLNLPKGHIGPVGLDPNIRVVFDSAVKLDAYYIIGALKKDYHFENYNPLRDQKKYEVADLRMARAGDETQTGNYIVQAKKGIEVGHIFQLGDKYTKALGVTVLGEDGKALTPIMGCYGIGVTRIVAAAIEQGHDQNGIIWPMAIAPYQVHFVSIVKSPEMEEKCNEIYKLLLLNGIEVLFDDRAKVGPGFKFKDADLLGLPFVLTFGERDFVATGLLELKDRKTNQVQKIKLDEIAQVLKTKIAAML